MALAAAQVVTTLAARLDSVPAYTGHVFTSRRWPLADADLPAWRLYAADEEVERVGLGEATHRHLVSVRAEGYTTVAADLDDALNALAATACAALFQRTAPYGEELQAPYGLELLGISRGEAQQGEALLGVVTLLVRAEIYVDAASPETILSS